MFLTKRFETFCTQMYVSNDKAINTVQDLLDDQTTLECFPRTQLQLKQERIACQLDSVTLHISFIFKHHMVSCSL